MADRQRYRVGGEDGPVVVASDMPCWKGARRWVVVVAGVYRRATWTPGCILIAEDEDVKLVDQKA